MKPTSSFPPPLTLTITFLALLIERVVSQNVTVPSTCTGNTTSGRDVVIYTVPYPYAAVLSIIGSYQNLTWSGNPPSTVTLNGSDNTVGTARTYDIQGAHLVETVAVYSSPPGGPYEEVHTAAAFYLPAADVSVYIPYDGTVVQSVCAGRATRFNFTAAFCADNVPLAAQVLHQVHTADAATVAQFLGGQNFTSCDALVGGPGNATATAPGVPVSTFAGGAVRSAGLQSVQVGLVGLVVAMML